MKMVRLLEERLAEALHRQLHDAEPGYCLRLDHFDWEEARSLCMSLRERVDGQQIHVWLLSSSPRPDDVEITPERAIEIRNRKQVRLGLIVPVGVLDAAASSLTNSFASFQLDRFWLQAADATNAALPDEVASLARRALRTPRGVLAASSQQRAEYLAAICESPTAVAAGRELWRLGLVPDLGSSDLVDRLERNQKCVRELVRPARANTSASERVDACKLREGTVKQELVKYLRDKRLRDAHGWLSGLADPACNAITFDRWQFEEISASDLEAIEVVPLLDPEGLIDPKSGFLQDGPGAQPVAPLGAKNKIKIKWSCQPKKPSSLKRWRAEVIPSRDSYADDAVPSVDLPLKPASAASRQVAIPMDVELPEGTGALAAQVRVVALDENGNELTDGDGRLIEGMTQEFWIAEHEVAPPPDGKGRRATALNVPLARIDAALSLPVESLEESSGSWTERELHFFDLGVNNRWTARLALSPVLRCLEERVIDDGDVCHRAATEGHSVIDPDRDVEPVELTALSTDEAGTRFLKARRQFLGHLSRQKHRRCLETTQWSETLSQQARGYAAAYEKLLRELQPGPALRDALRVDTLQLCIEMGDRTERSVLVLPTHPLRVVWYAAYADLLGSWETKLLECEKRQRSRLVDFGLLEQVGPLNCPAFVLDEDDRPYLAVQNLRFFWGVAVPVETRNPARQVANVARAVGFGEDEGSIADLPPAKIAEELQAYRSVHRYLETLRVNVVNPGGGGFVAEALRRFYSATTTDDGENGDQEPAAPPPRLDLIMHLPLPIPATLPPLARLQEELYEMRPRGRHHHLAPFFSIALRPESQVDRIPGGDVNVSLVMDRLQPAIELLSHHSVGDSCSLHGLLLRMLPEFTQDADGARWQHRFQLPEDSPNARHPAYRTKSSPLVELQRAYLNALARIIEPATTAVTPAVSVAFSAEEHRRLDAIHDLSDWVVTLDRFFGVEFFDGPSEQYTGDLSHKYLLDYAPEFLDGLGHRMLVTTAHREEVEEILARGMRDLGFRHVEDSVGRVLHHLKTISGRLALRVLGDDNKAREAVSLGIVAAWLKAQGELADAILVPIDAHPELFGASRKRRGREDSAARCDLMRVQFRPNRLTVTFIEVKSRSRLARSTELADRIVDQIEATEKVFQDHFFADPPRIDHVLQRARLATILGFYLRRAVRYGLITSEETRAKMEEAIGRLETGLARLRVLRWGFIVNLNGTPQRPLRHRDAEIRFLTSQDLLEAQLSAVPPNDAVFAPTPPPVAELPADLSDPWQVDVSPTVSSTDREPSNTGTARGDSPPAMERTPQAPPALERSAPEDKPYTAPDAVREGPSCETVEANHMERRPAAPPAFPEAVQVELGTDLDGDPVHWRASVRGSPHLFIIGIPGQGKSWTTTRLLCHMACQGLPALSIDFHGQLGAPEGRYALAANPAILDASKGLPFSPFEADMDQTAREGWWGTNAFAVAEIFEYVCSLGDIQRDIVYTALKDCYLDLGFEQGEASRPPTIDEFATRLAELEESRGVRNVTPRCRPLLEFGLFKPDSHGTELGDLLRGGVIVDVHNLGLEVLQIAAGAFVLRKIYKDMFRWGATDRLRLAIVLDEAHRLARDVTLPKLMKEGRKFGIVVIVASQGLPDYHPDVVANAGTKVVFRTNYPMSKKVAGFLRAPKRLDLSAAIEQLDVGEAFVQTPEMSATEHLRMHPLEQ